MRWALTRSTLVVALVLASPADRPAAEPPPLTIGKAERLLVIAPHPDDETLAAAGLVQRVLAQAGTVRVVLVTAGDGYVEGVSFETGQLRPRPAQYVAYGERRLREARAAVRELDGDRIRLGLLGFPDGGLRPLLDAHWRRSDPERSRTTGTARPPYPEALDPSVAYDGSDLHRELRTLLREVQPTIVAFAHPLDRHPDHAATGLFTALALKDWLREEKAHGAGAPQLLAYLVHWPGWPPDWDAPTPPAKPAVPLELPAALPVLGRGPTALSLTDDEVARKGAALKRYVTQQDVMPSLLAAFVRRTEPFTVLGAADVHDVAALVGQVAGVPPSGHDAR